MSRAWKEPNRTLPGWDGYRVPVHYGRKPKSKKRRPCSRRKSRQPFAPHKPPVQTVLQAVLGNHRYHALYVRRGSKWKLVRADNALEFLRFCGPKDAPRALANRGFSHQWVKRNTQPAPIFNPDKPGVSQHANPSTSSAVP